MSGPVQTSPDGRITQRVDADTLAVWNPDAQAWDYRNEPELKPGTSAAQSFGVGVRAAGRSLPATYAKGGLELVGSLADLGTSLVGQDTNIREQLPGMFPGIEESLRKQDEFAASSQEENPGATTAGRLVGSLPQIPGRIPAIIQGVTGGVEGGGLTNLGIEKAFPDIYAKLPQVAKDAIAAAEGGLLAMMGRQTGRQGREMNIAGAARGGRLGANAQERALEQQRQVAADLLEREGITLSTAEKSGDPRLIAQERARRVYSPEGTVDLQNRQRGEIGARVSQSLDVDNPGGLFGEKALDDIRTTVGAKFEQFADSVPAVNVDEQSLSRVIADAETLIDTTAVQKFTNMTLEAVTDPQGLTPEKFKQLRGLLSKRSSELYKRGLEGEAEYVGNLVDVLDDGLEAAIDPGVLEAYREGRRQWKLYRVLREPGVLNDKNQLNLPTFGNRLDKAYPSSLTGQRPEGGTGEVLNIVRRFNEVQNPFRDSGTASNLAPMLKSIFGNKLTGNRTQKLAANMVDEILQLEQGMGQGLAVGGQGMLPSAE